LDLVSARHPRPLFPDREPDDGKLERPRVIHPSRSCWLGFGVAVSLAGPACTVQPAEPGGGCEVGGQHFEPGERFTAPDGCNSCTCEAGGASCTEMACAQPCIHRGETHSPGDQFPAGDGCNTCRCEPGGAVSCTLMACGDCEYQGTSHELGETFPSGDGCATCTCEPGGVQCEATGCAIGCASGGPSFPAGATVPAGDGCNTCLCAGDGQFGCTKVACACDPAKEFGRDYVGGSVEECQVIDFSCPANTEVFANACGCGCEQDLWCPEYFSCRPGPSSGCDAEALGALCPYSGFAL
jgi:hypothetical protein